MSSPSNATRDRSAPRAAITAGDLSRDGRGRVRAMPPILNYGFRPFFFLAGLQAALAIPLWLAVYAGGLVQDGALSGISWHAHEMLFGFLSAVITGFLLTAIPNWTGRLPLSGYRLAGLVALWLAGRIACLFGSNPWLVMAIDLAFPAALIFAISREVIAGKNWKNAPVVLLVLFFGVANALDHLANLGIVEAGIGVRLATAATTMLIALIGGRIVPSFTRNWLVKARVQSLPKPFGQIDKIALIAAGIACGAWVVMPLEPLVGVALIAASMLLALRLARWRGLATLSDPIVIILHIGYAWVPVGLFLLGLSLLSAEVPTTAALHALTAGAFGTMTLAVMTRASLGHTGRAIRADWAISGMYLLVVAGAALRVAAPFAGDWTEGLLMAGGTMWAGGFLLFAIRFAPVLWGKRVSA